MTHHSSSTHQPLPLGPLTFGCIELEDASARGTSPPELGKGDQDAWTEGGRGLPVHQQSIQAENAMRTWVKHHLTWVSSV